MTSLFPSTLTFFIPRILRNFFYHHQRFNIDLNASDITTPFPFYLPLKKLSSSHRPTSAPVLHSRDLPMEEQEQQPTNTSGGSGGGSEISLRPLQLSDVDDFMVWATDPEVARLCRWEPYTSRDDALAYIEGTVLPHPYFQAICLNGRPVGSISVTWNEDRMEACRGELSYALGSGYWGRGIATEAVKMAVAEVFGERPELERVEAMVYVENKASQRVLEKAGFSREGVLRKYVWVKGRTRDVVVFSRLSTDDDS